MGGSVSSYLRYYDPPSAGIGRHAPPAGEVVAQWRVETPLVAELAFASILKSSALLAVRSRQAVQAGGWFSPYLFALYAVNQ